MVGKEVLERAAEAGTVEEALAVVGCRSQVTLERLFRKNGIRPQFRRKIRIKC